MGDRIVSSNCSRFANRAYEASLYRLAVGANRLELAQCRRPSCEIQRSIHENARQQARRIYERRRFTADRREASFDHLITCRFTYFCPSASIDDMVFRLVNVWLSPINAMETISRSCSCSPSLYVSSLFQISWEARWPTGLIQSLYARAGNHLSGNAVSARLTGVRQAKEHFRISGSGHGSKMGFWTPKGERSLKICKIVVFQ